MRLKKETHKQTITKKCSECGGSYKLFRLLTCQTKTNKTLRFEYKPLN